MYVNAVLLGVLATIFVEMAMVITANIAYNVYVYTKKSKRTYNNSNRH